MNPAVPLPDHSSNAAALALVVTLNWFIAHLATDWVMPPEVQSALQTLATSVMGWMLYKARLKAAAGPGAGGPASLILGSDGGGKA